MRNRIARKTSLLLPGRLLAVCAPSLRRSGQGVTARSLETFVDRNRVDVSPRSSNESRPCGGCRGGAWPPGAGQFVAHRRAAARRRSRGDVIPRPRSSAGCLFARSSRPRAHRQCEPLTGLEGYRGCTLRAEGRRKHASLVSVHKRMIFWPESIALGDELGRLGAISFAVAVAWADPAVYFLKIGIRVRPGLGQSR